MLQLTQQFGKINTHSLNYNLLFLPNGTNRKVNRQSVKAIKKELKKNGFDGLVIVIRTKAFDGVYKLYIIDGQHRYVAAQELNELLKENGENFHFHYKIKEFVNPDDDTKANINNLVAGHNSVGVRWSAKNFIQTKGALGIFEYVHFINQMKKYGLTPTDMKYAYLGGDSAIAEESFRDGTMKYNFFDHNEKKSQKRSDKIVEIVADLKHILPNKSYSRRSLYHILVTEYKSTKGKDIKYRRLEPEHYEKFVSEVKSKRKGFFIENEPKLMVQLAKIADKILDK